MNVTIIRIYSEKQNNIFITKIVKLPCFIFPDVATVTTKHRVKINKQRPTIYFQFKTIHNLQTLQLSKTLANKFYR